MTNHSALSLLAAGHRAGAVTYFMRSMVGVPAPVVVMMKLMPWIWRKMKAVAHTLPYDASRKKHDDMGFQVGWGKALEQLVEHVKKTRV